MVKVVIDQVQFQLKVNHNFNWLKELGKVFCVFDKNDSGNISFGVCSDSKKYFVKYAGAQTMNYKGKCEDAISNLKQAIRVYQVIQHPSLIHFVRSIEYDFGVVAIFDWVEGECLYAHWTFDMWNRFTCEKSAYYRYHHLPVEKRLKSIDVIFSFLCLVESLGYVAVDLYDGSILYDFYLDTTMICDIDFYKKAPILNTLGCEYWGSSRVKAPEENEMNALVDSISNVYTMGRLILCLLCDEKTLSYETWIYEKEAYEIVMKATQIRREFRYQSVDEFRVAWNEVVSLG